MARNIHIGNGNYNEHIGGDYIQSQSIKTIKYPDGSVKRTIKMGNKTIKEFTDRFGNISKEIIEVGNNINISSGILNVSGAGAFGQGKVTGTIANNYLVPGNDNQVSQSIFNNINTENKFKIGNVSQTANTKPSTTGTNASTQNVARLINKLINKVEDKVHQEATKLEATKEEKNLLKATNKLKQTSKEIKNYLDSENSIKTEELVDFWADEPQVKEEIPIPKTELFFTKYGKEAANIKADDHPSIRMMAGLNIIEWVNNNPSIKEFISHNREITRMSVLKEFPGTDKLIDLVLSQL